MCPQVFVPSKNSNRTLDNHGSTAVINILEGLRSEAKEQTGDGGSDVASGMQGWVQMDLRTSAGFFCRQELPCGEMGWWPHRDAFHLLISVQVHLWNKPPAWIVLWQPECKQALLICVPQGCQTALSCQKWLFNSFSLTLSNSVAQVEHSKVNK